MFFRRLMKTKSEGLYTVEGAFTIIIFTALFMMLLSIIPIIRTESIVQSAINQTAMELSEYSYAVCSSSNTSEETDLLKSILQDAKREALGFASGSIICQQLTKDRIDEKALKIVDGGYSGISFAASNILGDGETISVIAIYKINVETFGLVDKTLTICQKAQTKAWLPYDAETLASTSASDVSIWSQTNFVRGKHFIEELKNKYKSHSVKSGQGIDLYDSTTGKVSEIYSLNIFSSSYSYNAKDSNDVCDYSPNSENIRKQIYEYVEEMQSDIYDCGSTIEMEDGATEKLEVAKKEIIIVLPEEAKDNEIFVSFFEELKAEIKSDKNVILKFLYMEEAF